jgi:hypothetical protein
MAHGIMGHGGREKMPVPDQRPIPEQLRLKLMAAFKGREMMTRPGWFVIWNDQANDALLDRYGVVTGEQPEYSINDAFVVRFDWNLQRFIVRA